MKFNPRKINFYLLFKLPAAFLTGVRVNSISDTTCLTTVRHRWINQNPFNSIFWAVQGMAAELSTGVLVMASIRESKEDISMLVANNRGSFLKKARGRITFSCLDGSLIKNSIQRAIATGEGQTFWVKSEGRDSAGAIVSVFEFEWTIKLRLFTSERESV